jgi:hypothetical protein
MDHTVVSETLTLDGIVYASGQEVLPEVWLRLPERERNAMLHAARVEQWRVPAVRVPTPLS